MLNMIQDRHPESGAVAARIAVGSFAGPRMSKLAIRLPIIRLEDYVCQ